MHQHLRQKTPLLFPVLTMMLHAITALPFYRVVASSFAHLCAFLYAGPI